MRRYPHGAPSDALEQLSPDTRVLIEAMCAYRDDGSIARFVGCAVATVAHVRSRISRRKRGRPPRQAHVIATKSEIQDRSITDADTRIRAFNAAACDTLLRRQLEAGQHSLTADQFHALCAAKGWMDAVGARKSGG